MLKRTSIALLALATLLFPSALAQDGFPSKPITVVIPYGAGGMTDLSNRILATALEQRLGGRVDVVNRPGAGGYLGFSEAMRENDGHTIVAVTTDIFANTVLLDRDFTMDGVALLGSYMPQERVLFGHPSAPFSDFEGLIEHAAENRVRFADGGALWAGNVVKAMAKEDGVNIVHIPFESGAEGSAALLGGHVEIGETGVGTPAWQAAKNGELNMLAVITDGDLSAFGFDDVPNLEDLGYDHVVRMYYGWAVSPDVPEEIRARLEAAMEDVVTDPEVVAKLEAVDLTPRFMASDEYAEIVDRVLGEAADLQGFIQE